MKILTKLLAFSVLLSTVACNNDDDDNGSLGPAPTINLTSQSASNAPGQTVSTTANIEASEGLNSLIVLQNGVEVEGVNGKTYNGETQDSYDFQYTIPEDATSGTSINFTFQAIDTEDRTSNLAAFTVNVSSEAAREIVEINGERENDFSLTGEHTWTADKIYRLNGFVRVGRDGGPNGGVQETGILNIEPGTLVIGDRETKGTLIIQRGSQIFARGTKEQPIIMTSEREPGLREAGDWGGLVIVGRARNNQGNNVELEGNYGAWHGGDDDADNSGVVQYVRIEYAGIPINPNEEVNSLTMGSIGSGTVIEYVQCSYGLDDAFEWFGGTADAKYLVAYRGFDDDFDVDFGFSGNVQFGLGIRAATNADQSGSNGFEVDNDGQGSTLTPFTSATFSNMTIVGPKKETTTAIQQQFQHAMHLRRSNRLKIYNSFFAAYPYGLYIDGSVTQQHAGNDELQLRNNVLAGVEGWGSNGYGAGQSGNNGVPIREVDGSGNAITIAGQTPTNWFMQASFNNEMIDTYQEAGLSSTVFDLGTPTLLLQNDFLRERAGWENTPEAGDFFEQVDFVGAFGDEDWTEGWTEWNPQSQVYR